MSLNLFLLLTIICFATDVYALPQQVVKQVQQQTNTSAESAGIDLKYVWTPVGWQGWLAEPTVTPQEQCSAGLRSFLFSPVSGSSDGVCVRFLPWNGQDEEIAFTVGPTCQLKAPPQPSYTYRLPKYYSQKNQCYCPKGTLMDFKTSYCEEVPMKVSIKGNRETRPLKTGGQSTVELEIQVSSEGQPVIGVSVGVAVEAAANTGGHDHADGQRPKGKLSATQGFTDSNGKVTVSFQASQISGLHVVAATCDSCSEPATHEIIVKVPDLVNVFALPFRDAPWAYPSIGETPSHTDNHYLTVAATYRLLEIASKYRKIWPNSPKLALNDMSLKWGGKFDIDGTWDFTKGRHAEHRIGDNADIRANNAPGAVPAAIRGTFSRWIKGAPLPKDNIPVDLLVESIDLLHESIGTDGEHFHFRLGN